jgi:hypothetical protein
LCSFIWPSKKLGDLIDGQCAKRESSDEDLKAVTDKFARLDQTDFLHLIGNHELYNFDRLG